jgi:group I intron endonuclease
MFVYQITNKINGKMYIGQHSGPDLQWYWMKKKGARRLKTQQALFNAMMKYGTENFEIKPLVIVGTKQEMDYYEKGLIKALNTKGSNGYNMTEGGEGTVGFSPSTDVRKRIAASLLGKSKPNKLKGVPRTEETKERISKGSMGKIPSKEHIASLKKGSHNRYHVKRNVVNPECLLCIEGSNNGC